MPYSGSKLRVQIRTVMSELGIALQCCRPVTPQKKITLHKLKCHKCGGASKMFPFSFSSTTFPTNISKHYPGVICNGQLCHR